jgi:hypothetical protein
MLSWRLLVVLTRVATASLSAREPVTCPSLVRAIRVHGGLTVDLESTLRDAREEQ